MSFPAHEILTLENEFIRVTIHAPTSEEPRWVVRKEGYPAPVLRTSYGQALELALSILADAC